MIGESLMTTWTACCPAADRSGEPWPPFDAPEQSFKQENSCYDHQHFWKEQNILISSIFLDKQSIVSSLTSKMCITEPEYYKIIIKTQAIKAGKADLAAKDGMREYCKHNSNNINPQLIQDQSNWASKNWALILLVWKLYLLFLTW